MEITISECFRQNTCYDCDNVRCAFHGKKEADCPKYQCDRPGGILENDCEHCEFIDEYIEAERKFYKEEKQ